jgi:hypothetical protein
MGTMLSGMQRHAHPAILNRLYCLHRSNPGIILEDKKNMVGYEGLDGAGYGGFIDERLVG